MAKITTTTGSVHIDGATPETLVIQKGDLAAKVTDTGVDFYNKSDTGYCKKLFSLAYPITIDGTLYPDRASMSSAIDIIFNNDSGTNTSLDKMIDNQESQLTKQDTQIVIEQKIADNTDTIITKLNSVITNQGDIEGLINTTNTKLDTNNTKLDKLDDVNSKLDAVNSELDSLSAAITTLSSKLDTVITRLTTIATNTTQPIQTVPV